MKVLIDIVHPAHVHFFYHPIKLLRARDHEILITSRDKEIALDLLDELGLQHEPLSSQGRGGLFSLGSELIRRNIVLYRVVKRFHPDIMAGISGASISHVGKITGVPSLVFYDTENATLQNAITYPFASCVIVPRCYEAWVPRHRHIRYNGYHELSYLHPKYFSPDRELAVKNGLATEGNTFLVRLVSWQASHDIGEGGWSVSLLNQVVSKLKANGKVIISAEGALPPDMECYRYRGSVSDIHHVMAFCRAYIGESATMASESAVLGVPALYAAETGRGYTNEQEVRYHLVKNIRELSWENVEVGIEGILNRPPEFWQKAREHMLEETVDVAATVAGYIENFPHRGTQIKI